MSVLDLRSIRCPMALLTLKRELLSMPENPSLKLLFSTESAMLDIKRYLDKKAYHYQQINDQQTFSLIIIINTGKGNTYDKTAN